MNRRAILGAYSGVANVVVNSALLLVFVPVFIRELGLPTYGVYALITGSASLNVFTNFGFNTSLIKHLSEQQHSGDSSYDIVASFAVIGGASLAVSAAVVLFMQGILSDVLNVPSEMMTQEVKVFYIACVASSLFQMLGLVPGAVLDAQQRVYITNTIQLAMNVLGRGAILASLFLQPSLATVGWIMLGASGLGFILLTGYARLTWGPVLVPEIRAKFVPIVRKHFRYGRNIYASSVLGFFYEPLAKVLMSHYVGLTAVGSFDIALRVKGMIWSVTERLLYPALPLMAAQRGASEARRIIVELQSKLSLLVIPLALGMVFLSAPLVSVWLGSQSPSLVAGIASIVSCYVLTLFFVPVYHFLTVKGHPEKTLLLQAVNVVVNLVAFFALVPPFGYYGAVAAFCLAVLSSSAVCAWLQRRILGGPVLERTALRGLFVLGAVILAGQVVVSTVIPDARMRIVALLAANLTATVAVLRWLRLVTREDVARYIGGTNPFGMLLRKLLVGGA